MSEQVSVFREERGVSLHDAECGRGVEPRYLHDGVPDRGVDPRNLHDKGYGRGARSRYEEGLVQDRVEREMESMTLKAKWLEKEIASFKKALDVEGKRGSSQHWNPEYWSRPTSHHLDCQGDRVSTHQVRQGDRASTHPDCHEDRASIHPDCQGDRASIHQVRQGDRASTHQDCQADRAGTHQDQRGDRAGTQEECQGPRGAVQQGHLPVGSGTGVANFGSGSASDQGGSGPKLELPALPGTISPMDLGDWLILVGPVMRDLSQHSAKWWQRTMEEATRYYEIWRTASPLQRVQLQVGLPTDLMAEHYGRTEQRGVGLLLRAVPEEMKKALISNRDVTSTAIIWRLLTTFQPGGAGEKSTILKSLTSLQVGSSAAELATAIRQWRRCFQRAQEIGASLPDGTLMVHGLEPGAALLGRLDGQSAFRVASARSELRVDEQPTQESVWAYSQVLLAEAETLHLAGTVTSTSTPKPQVKQLGLPGPKAGGQSQSQGVCRFWGSEAGCKHGRSCKFAHPQLADFKERCWLCSSTSHRKMDCPARALGGGSQNTSAGGGGNGLSPDGSAFNKDGKGGEKGNGGKGQGKKGGKDGKDGKKLEDKPTINKTVTEDIVAEDGKEGKSPRPSTGKGGVASSTPAAATGETLMGEVAGLLRSLRLQQEPSPALRGCQVRRLGAHDAVRCLLDGGATHCLRQCENEIEWSKGVEVSVSLAQGDVWMRQDPSTTTLLTKERVQPIVPLSKVAALGFRVQWDSTECRIHHPQHGSLEVIMEQGCPTVDLKVGKWLMSEVEEHQRSVRSMKAVLSGAVGDGSPEQNRWRVLRELFPEVPLRVLQRVPGRMKWQGENLPFNRRQRRKVERAKYVIVHAFCGKDDGYWKQLETNEVAVLALDLSQGADLADPDLGGYLEDLAIQGKIDLWISGPPCRSTSVARHRPDGGPPPLRSRNGQGRFGLPTLDQSQQEKTDLDSVLWLRNLWWIWLAHQHRASECPPLETLIEQPQDPCEWKDEKEPYPTFTKWPETKRVMEDLKMNTTRINQGGLGHPTVKPTALLNSIKEVQALNGVGGNSQTTTTWPADVQDRVQFSKTLARWAPGLKQVLKEVIVNRTARVNAKIKRFSKAEKDSVAAWQAHFDFGHVPFRHDCSVCLESAGRDRQRRQLEHKTSYCLSVDIAGPFQPGLDQAQGQEPRYFLVANLSVPVNSSGPMVAGLQDLGFRLQPPVDEATREDQGVEDNFEGPGGEQGQPAQPDPAPEDPMQLQEPERGDSEPAPEVEVVDRSDQEQKWKEFIHGTKEVDSKVLSFALPVVSRKAHHVIPAVASVYARARSMQVPIIRVHTDRAQEFAGVAFRKWCLDRSLWHTMSPGDEPTQNARVERTIGLLKNKVRTSIKASKAPISWWPLALRHAAESMLRDQLWTMGIFTPRLPVFGATGIAKTKTWHQCSVPWKFPGCKVRIWGPAMDMSITSGGVYVQDEEGRWMRSTVVRPVSDPPVDEQGQVIAAVPNNQCGGSSLVTPANHQEAGGVASEDSNKGSGELHHAGDEIQLVDGRDQQDHVVEVIQDLQQFQQARGLHKIPLRHRLHGKQTVEIPDHGEPALFVLRAGGESGPGIEEEMLMAQQQERQWLEGLKLTQHRMLKQLVNEEVGRLQEGQGSGTEATVIQEMHSTLEGLEKELCQLRAIQAAETGEVLQTQTVSLEEVKKDLQAWVEPFKTEVDTILQSGAMEVIDDERYQQLLKDHPDLERLPMLAVATIKPPLKRKGRVVVCGNHSTKQPQQGEPDPSVGGVDTVAIRTILALAAQRQLQIGSLDVKGAFLQAPRRSVAIRPTVCDPPNLLKQMNLVGKTEKWLVHKALYGFVESPSDWSFHRDQTLTRLRWQSQGRRMRFKQTAEKHVWQVVQEDQTDHTGDFGYVAVYVDDLLMAVSPEHMEGVVSTLRSAWTCSEPEFVTGQGPMRFCGFELQWVSDGGLRLSQEGFIAEMLKRREVSGETKFPLPPISDEPDEDPINLSDVRQAQGVVGELTWLTTRSRPDLAFSVGAASRLIHRRPRYVISMCEHIMKYVNLTSSLALTYRQCATGDMGQQQELQVAKSMDTMQIFSDASFGPVHERCRSISGCVIEFAGCVVAWDSQAQPFVSQSTAEAEVISYNSACQTAESISCLLQELGYPTTKHLYGDSKAGIAVVANDCGPWRTRHLRLRAAKLRELVQCPSQPWCIRHISGCLLVADGCTKPLTYQAFDRFLQRLGMERRQEEQQAKIQRCMLGQEEIGNEINLHETVLAVVCGLLFWMGHNQAGSGLLAVLAGLRMLQYRKLKTSQEIEGNEKPRICAFRGPPEESERRGGAQERGLAAMEQNVLGGLARLRITSTVEVECESPGLSTQRSMRTGGYEQPPTRSSGGGQPSSRNEGEVHREPSSAVWELPQFRFRPRGADRWEQDLCREGWLVRIHGSKGRVRPFHPLHRSCPLKGDQLTGERVTVVVAADGSREVLHDDWNCQRTWQRPGPWGGYTFLRLHAAAQEGYCRGAPIGTSQSSQSLPVSVAIGASQCSQSLPVRATSGASQGSQSVQRRRQTSESVAFGPEGESDGSYTFVSGDEF